MVLDERPGLFGRRRALPASRLGLASGPASWATTRRLSSHAALRLPGKAGPESARVGGGDVARDQAV